MRPFRIPLTLAAALITTTAACASVGRGPAANGGATTLVVRNHNLSDMNVYAVSAGGARVLLGFAPGETTTRFTLPETATDAGSLRLTADPIGGFGVARSGPLVVDPGARVTFTVEQDLALSVATVR
jgi:hypothetical protein